MQKRKLIKQVRTCILRTMGAKFLSEEGVTHREKWKVENSEGVGLNWRHQNELLVLHPLTVSTEVVVGVGVDVHNIF